MCFVPLPDIAGSRLVVCWWVVDIFKFSLFIMRNAYLSNKKPRKISMIDLCKGTADSLKYNRFGHLAELQKSVAL